jgi:hypothetical protein
LRQRQSTLSRHPRPSILSIHLTARRQRALPTNDYGDLGSKSDEELLAMERDTSLPIDVWTAVEAERGRRQRGRAETPQPAAATLSSSVPPAVPPAAELRLHRGLRELESILLPGERLLAYAVQRRLFALTHRRTIVAATTGRFIALHRGLFGGFTPSTCAGRTCTTRASVSASSTPISSCPHW